MDDWIVFGDELICSFSLAQLVALRRPCKMQDSWFERTHTSEKPWQMRSSAHTE